MRFWAIHIASEETIIMTKDPIEFIYFSGSDSQMKQEQGLQSTKEMYLIWIK